MNTQESNKRGKRSGAQTRTRARSGDAPLPPAIPVGGSSGKHRPDSGSDVDLPTRTTEKTMRDAKAK